MDNLLCAMLCVSFFPAEAGVSSSYRRCIFGSMISLLVDVDPIFIFMNMINSE